MFEVTDIKKSYRNEQILRGASFSARPGDCIAITGCNGSGKSTLLNILAGLTAPDSGSIRLNGTELKTGHPDSRLGYAPQNTPLMEELSVRDNLSLWYDRVALRGTSGAVQSIGPLAEVGGTHKGTPEAVLWGRTVLRAAAPTGGGMAGTPQDVLRMLGIDRYLGKRVSRLSGGMKKRVSIAMAAAGAPQVLLLDEPSAALDPEGREIVRQFLDGYRAGGGTVVMVTHDLADVLKAGSCYALRGGILYPFRPEEVHDGILY